MKVWENSGHSGMLCNSESTHTWNDPGSISQGMSKVSPSRMSGNKTINDYKPKYSKIFLLQ